VYRGDSQLPITYNAQANNQWMDLALEQARAAGERGEVPVGAVVVQDNRLIGAAGNQVINQCDPTAHAEILAIREAAQFLGRLRLVGCDLYVTLEPCPMCATALSFARVRRVIFGAYDPKGGGIDHGPRIFELATCHHRPELLGGIREQACARLLKDFFVEKR
jgi:tRNA(adenine34) deaminase